MAPRLTDKKKKKIIADYVELGSYRAVARRNGISNTTAREIVLRDSETAQKLTQKKDQDTADILAYMDSKRDIVCAIIGNGLEILSDPEKLREATPAQITTAMGTLIDKWTALRDRGSAEDKVEIIIDV